MIAPRLLARAGAIACLLVCLLAPAAGCSGSATTTRGAAAAPPPLHAPSPRVAPFFMRQILHVDRGEGEPRRLDVVVQYASNQLTVAFLSPVGRPLVVMVQRGTTADVSGPGVGHIPFDLRWVLQEIGAALLLSPLAEPGREGEQQRATATGPAREIWRSGRLIRRVVDETGTQIAYDWGQSPCPDAIHVLNETRGYELMVETTQCDTDMVPGDPR